MLRIEDTDRERSTPENVEQILDALNWLELDWDEGPHSQAERAPAHAAAVDELLARGRAYEDEGAIRVRVPDEGETVIQDLIRGEVRFPLSVDPGLRGPALRREPALQPRRGGGRPRHGRDPRDPRRRSPLQHSAAGADPRRARRRAPGVRAPAAAVRTRRQEALQAPRGGVGAGAARARATCPRRCATTSPCSAGATRSRARSSPRRAGEALRPRACRRARPCSTSRSCAG